MRFQDFNKYLEALENTSGRIEMYGLPGELFQKAGVEETRRIACLCEGRMQSKRSRAVLALRFPRVVGFVRRDKPAEDAKTALEIEEMYAQQRNAKKSARK